MTQLLVIGFLKAIRGKAYLKINLLVETPLHRPSMEVRRSGLWAPGFCQILGCPVIHFRLSLSLRAYAAQFNAPFVYLSLKNGTP